MRKHNRSIKMNKFTANDNHVICDNTSIAQCHNGPWETQCKNATLFAAAPDILAALNNILVGMKASGGWVGDDALFEEGMVAYNKATKVTKEPK
jgi:hypothetical protein